MTTTPTNNACYEVAPKYIAKTPKKRGPQFTCSITALDYILPLYEEAGDMQLRERFLAVYLSRANRVICHEWVSVGGTSATVVDLKIIAMTAVKMLATNVVLAHNHPSGNTKPSSSDLAITKKAVDGLQLLDIKVLDHMIVGEDGYYSFADEGEL